MYNCLIFGAGGAVGSEFVKLLIPSKNWQNVYIVARKSLPEWKELQNNPRFHFLETPEILDTNLIKKQLIGNSKIDAVFNFLGSRVKTGEENFRKVDCEYVVKSAKFSEEIHARQFHHVGAQVSDKNSCFLYVKVKGECAEQLQKINLESVFLYQPGLITERKEERFIEKISKWVPFIDKIKCENLAEQILKCAEMNLGNEAGKGKGFLAYKNSEILKL